ncbi:sulfate/molybdate ABC transporter ATP-binding protein [soil metagenome]
MSIEVRNISKTFGKFQALKDISLTIATGELVALLGPSGSGKTTLLRIIAGLEAADAGLGNVLFHEQDVTRSDVGQRGVGFVFQHYALFRHMSVLDNVAFGLRVRPWRDRPKRKEIRERSMELLKLVQLDRFVDRYPSQLSGGQRQRVALARALAVEPKVLLLDEPFGALDAKVRRELRRWLRKLHDEVHITSVFVTHDQEEALEVADRVAVMNEGVIEQIGTPQDVYDKPASKFVYNFLGNVNLFAGRIDHGQVQVGDQAVDLSAHAGDVRKTAASNADETTVYVRPHDIDVSRVATDSANIRVKVDHISPIGPIVRLYLQRCDTSEMFESELTRERYVQLQPRVGEELFAAFNNARVFADDYSI